ncbi:hypothetical protein B0H12DRAFT_1241173 [Mycena haematopus]|nr:hypothetical protein B0H12DRAFT_1241173 [Mycena haematopus]
MDVSIEFLGGIPPSLSRRLFGELQQLDAYASLFLRFGDLNLAIQINQSHCPASVPPYPPPLWSAICFPRWPLRARICPHYLGVTKLAMNAARFQLSKTILRTQRSIHHHFSNHPARHGSRTYMRRAHSMPLVLGPTLGDPLTPTSPVPICPTSTSLSISCLLPLVLLLAFGSLSSSQPSSGPLESPLSNVLPEPWRLGTALLVVAIAVRRWVIPGGGRCVRVLTPAFPTATPRLPLAPPRHTSTRRPTAPSPRAAPAIPAIYPILVYIGPAARQPPCRTRPSVPIPVLAPMYAIRITADNLRECDARCYLALVYL